MVGLSKEARSKVAPFQAQLAVTYAGMIAHFFKVTMATYKGRALLAVWLLSCTSVCGVGALKAIRRRAFRANRKKCHAQFLAADAKEGDRLSTSDAIILPEKKKSVSGGARSKSNQFLPRLKNILQIVFPSVFSKEFGHLTAYTALLLVRIWLTIRIAELTGSLGKLVGAREWEHIFKLQVYFGMVCVPASLVNSALKYEANKLALSMRTRLVNHIHNRLLHGNVFYRASSMGKILLDNIDQRCTSDVAALSTNLATLYGNILKPVLEVVLYTRQLAKMLGGRQLVFFFVYFFATARWIQFAMPHFGKLTAEQQRLEGNFRTHHMRLLNHSEEIAFYGGADRERQMADLSYKEIKKVNNRVFLLRLIVSVLDQYAVKYGGSMMAFVMMLPAVYLNQRNLGRMDSVEVTGYYLTATQLFKALGEACKNLYMSSYKGFTTVSGLTMRVAELIDNIDRRGGDGREDEEALKIKDNAQVHPGYGGVPPTVKIGDTIMFDNVDIFSPEGNLLCGRLCMKIGVNDHVIIEGPNGAGKSSILRTLCGLWPLCGGTLTKPDPSCKSMFYVPQRPYFPPGSLRDQVTYPEKPEADAELDAKLQSLMVMVGLPTLVSREGGWDAKKDWMDVFSGGEKQRIAFCRLFYHRPKYAVLDEATSAISADIEVTLISRCRSLSITMISVSHRPQLRKLHSFAIVLDGAGGYRIEKLEGMTKTHSAPSLSGLGA